MKLFVCLSVWNFDWKLVQELALWFAERLCMCNAATVAEAPQDMQKFN
jgi:hypothetical protein